MLAARLMLPVLSNVLDNYEKFQFGQHPVVSRVMSGFQRKSPAQLLPIVVGCKFGVGNDERLGQQ